jgi:hypothetical protein
MRTAYTYKNLSDHAKKNAGNLYAGEDLTQWLYSKNGVKFKHSTEVQL